MRLNFNESQLIGTFTISVPLVVQRLKRAQWMEAFKCALYGEVLKGSAVAKIPPIFSVLTLSQGDSQ